MKKTNYLKFFMFFLSFGFMACSSDDDSNSVSSITLEADKMAVNVGGVVNFTVTTNIGDDVTGASIIYVDDTEIDKNQFQTTIEGSFKAYAVYQDFTSDPITIIVDNDISLFTKRVLVEDYTSIHCGNCPRVAHAIDLLGAETNNMVAVGIHGPFGGQQDPFHIEHTVLKNEFGIDGLPAARLNRTTTWVYPEVDNLAQATDLTGYDASVGLAIDPVLNGGDLEVDLKIKFGKDFSTQNLKYVVYVLESGLIADQLNYTPYYNGDDVINDFEYNHVLRASLTDLLGNAIPAGETSLGNVYTKNISVAVPATNVADIDNMHIVAFVVDANGNVLNVRSADLGEVQTFEEN